LTHLGGAVVFAAFAIDLLRRGGGDRLRAGALVAYVVGVVGTLLASGVLHVVDPTTELRGTLARVDHAAIFALIAGTYTPVHVIQFEGGLRWGVLGVVWAAALSGMVLKVLFFTQIPEWMGLSLYLGLGWAGLISAVALYRLFGLRPLIPLVVGALFYTTGACFDFLDVPVLISGVVASHETFHLFVLVGIASHWLYIHRIADPLQDAAICASRCRASRAGSPSAALVQPSG
jgi:channel protein (hemolysin III family)